MRTTLLSFFLSHLSLSMCLLFASFFPCMEVQYGENTRGCRPAQFFNFEGQRPPLPYLPPRSTSGRKRGLISFPFHPIPFSSNFLSSRRFPPIDPSRKLSVSVFTFNFNILLESEARSSYDASRLRISVTSFIIFPPTA